MLYKNVGITFFRSVTITNHAFDRRTDRILIASPRVCISCGAVKMVKWQEANSGYKQQILSFIKHMM